MAKLKKGSAAAKAWGRKMQRLRNSGKKKKSRSYSTKLTPKRRMAKRRYTKKRKTSRKRTASILGINTAKALAAMLYGAGRSKVSNKLLPYTSKIPLGGISDEVGMLGAQWALKKFLFKKAGLGRDVLNVGQGIELARIGEAIISGDISIPFFNSSSATNSNSYVFN